MLYSRLDPKYADVTIARYIFWKRKAQEDSLSGKKAWR
jgi:hypothetical protein